MGGKATPLRPLFLIRKWEETRFFPSPYPLDVRQGAAYTKYRAFKRKTFSSDIAAKDRQIGEKKTGPSAFLADGFSFLEI
jgi:hypothetical protein